jgi:hypothetical protein
LQQLRGYEVLKQGQDTFYTATALLCLVNYCCGYVNADHFHQVCEQVLAGFASNQAVKSPEPTDSLASSSDSIDLTLDDDDAPANLAETATDSESQLQLCGRGITMSMHKAWKPMSDDLLSSLDTDSAMSAIIMRDAYIIALKRQLAQEALVNL